MNMPLDQWSGAAATRELQAALERCNGQTAEQNRQLVRMTRWIALLTVVMVVGQAVQTWLVAAG